MGRQNIAVVETNAEVDGKAVRDLKWTSDEKIWKYWCEFNIHLPVWICCAILVALLYPILGARWYGGDSLAAMFLSHFLLAFFCRYVLHVRVVPLENMTTSPLARYWSFQGLVILWCLDCWLQTLAVLTAHNSLILLWQQVLSSQGPKTFSFEFQQKDGRGHERLHNADCEHLNVGGWKHQRIWPLQRIGLRFRI